MGMTNNEDLFVLMAELCEAKNDTQLAEIAARIVDLDGGAKPGELNDRENVQLALDIAQEELMRARYARH
jgi:hypothetical protein